MATAAFDAAALEVRNHEEGLLQPRCCCPGSLVCSSRKYDPVSALSLQSTSMPFHLNLIRMRAALIINDRFATITQPFSTPLPE